MATSVIKSGFVAVVLLWASPSTAQMKLDYSGLLAPQLGYINSNFALAPLSHIPFPEWNTPELVGRFAGRFDVRTYYEGEYGRSGIDVGLYSNLNTAYDRRRGIVPFDRVNLQLTRIRPETPLDFDRLQLFHEGSYGRLEAGWGTGINERQAVTAPLNWGLGSVGGDYPYFVDKPIDVGFVSLTTLGSANPSPRVAYYTAPVYGTTLGVSYQPDTRNTGFDFVYGGRQLGLLGRRSNADVDLYWGGKPLGVRLAPLHPVNGSFEGYTAGFTDVFEAGLRSEQQFGNWWTKASLGAITGTAVKSPLNTRFNDLHSFQGGFQVGYKGWSVGAGAVWAGDSGYSTEAHWRQRQNQYSVHGGIQYQTGPWTFGVATLLSDDAGDPTERSDRQLHVYSGGLRYQLAANIDVGAEVNYTRALSADYGDRNVYMGLVQLRYKFDGSLAR
jgi:hypothetical protein